MTLSPFPSTAGARDDSRDVELLQSLAEARAALTAQIGRRIIGQRELVDALVASLLAGGHALLVGAPGLAKTLLVQTVAQALALDFSRVQFTPDLMPSDITGTEVLEEDHATGRRVFTFVKGPIFGNVVLADEINRAPPKTQAALLQAMQEHAVTAAGRTHRLPEPFFVLATQNPIEQEGTYPLPEAQLDRFMFELRVGYPSRDEEEAIVTSTTGAPTGAVTPVIDAAQLLALQALVRRLPAPPTVVRYAVRLARSTRPDEPDASADVRRYVSWGAGPRASQYLVLGAMAARRARPRRRARRGAPGAAPPRRAELPGRGRGRRRGEAARPARAAVGRARGRTGRPSSPPASRPPRVNEAHPNAPVDAGATPM